MTIFSCNVLNAIPLMYVSMNNQECKIRPEIISINSNVPSFYPYSILANKCSSCSCNKVAVVIILMIHMLNHGFLMLLKTEILKYLI